MKMRLPDDVKKIIEQLERAGYEGFAVGGCVRDTLLGKAPQDWDITTSAKPEQVKALFSHTIDTGIEHGTVTVMLNHVGYEVTTYRIDGEYEDARHPREVTFTENLREDLCRRDFTINAMAYSERIGLVDLFGGQEDLERGVVKCVGDARERFREDALRMLRAIRFSAQLGFSIEESTADGIRALAPSIRKISAERVAAELLKTITSSHPDYLYRAYELGLTNVFFPEFDVMMETPQNTRHHCYTVGKHTLVAMEQIDADKILRLTMLLHDVAKPKCMKTDEKGISHFDGHQEAGVDMAKIIMRRLKLDNDTIRTVSSLIRYHDERPKATPVNVRKLMNRIGPDLFPPLLKVKLADTMAQSEYCRAEKLAYIECLRTLNKEITEKKECVVLADLAVDGRDLLSIGIEQGRWIGITLQALLEHVIENPEQNERDVLLELAKTM